MLWPKALDIVKTIKVHALMVRSKNMFISGRLIEVE